MRSVAVVLAFLAATAAPGSAEQKPKEYPFTIRVLKAESQPYTTRSNGGSQTNCNFTDYSANCNTTDSSVIWRHVQNTMAVEASDGKVYTLSCTASFRWSKCVWLQTGTTFPARWEKHGLVVLYHDSKGKQHEQTYSIIGSSELPKPAPSPQPAPQDAQQSKGKCNIVSTPPAAEIWVDGAFVGNTPSLLSLRPGKHSLAVSVTGYTTWTRELTVESGSEVSVSAILEKSK